MSYLSNLDPSKLDKVLVKEGDSTKDRPKRFDQVKVLFSLSTKDGKLIEQAIKDDAPFQVKVGDADLMRGFNLALTQLCPSEAARFTIPEDLCDSERDNEETDKEEKHTNGDGLVLDITLLEVDANVKVTKWDLLDHEKLEYGTKCKEEGNQLFKLQKWIDAEEKYSQTIEIIEWDKSPKRMALKVNTLYNLSQALSNQKRYVSAMEKINWAINLKPQEAKGYFRKSNVYFAMQDYEKALEELSKAKNLEPSNPDIINEIVKVKKAREEYRKNSTKMYGKIFEKDVYEEKATCEYSDNLNPTVELDITCGEEMLSIKIELFSNILPDTVNYFEQLLKSGALNGYISSEVKKNSFIVFNSPQPEDDPFKDFEPENKSTKVKSAGMLYFRPRPDTSTCRSEVCLSLSPLPWLDGTCMPFALVCSPADYHARLSSMYRSWQAVNDDSDGGSAFCVKNCRMN